MKGCLTCIGGTSLVTGVEEDASNNAGMPESGIASCGSCMMIGVC